MTGTIRTICPACDAENRVEVAFPAYNRGFDTTEYVCPMGIRFRAFMQYGIRITMPMWISHPVRCRSGGLPIWMKLRGWWRSLQRIFPPIWLEATFWWTADTAQNNRLKKERR